MLGSVGGGISEQTQILTGISHTRTGWSSEKFLNGVNWRLINSDFQGPTGKDGDSLNLAIVGGHRLVQHAQCSAPQKQHSSNCKLQY